MCTARDVRVEDVPDVSIVAPTDAIVRVTAACIGGSDLWRCAELERTEPGHPMGHEAIGLVEDVGAEVQTRPVTRTWAGYRDTLEQQHLSRAPAPASR